ncbi:MAG: polyprenol monophosphomannose synthase [Pseudobdellovibrionaceae bacterium]
MKTLVIVPTYNERENIGPLVESVFAQNLGLEILVVDDNSPDGTGAYVEELKKKFSKLHLLSRAGKEGLGKAYIAGFEWGLSQGFEALVEMDADFSHRPVDLKPLLTALQSADFAVGSRYVAGGSTLNWGLMRKIISRGGSIYSRLILGFPLNDWTGGFNAWKAETLKKINLPTVKSNGYSFQIELKYKAMKAGCRGVESPILFEDRRVGQSKMSSRIVLEALYRVWLLRMK